MNGDFFRVVVREPRKEEARRDDHHGHRGGGAEEVHGPAPSPVEKDGIRDEGAEGDVADRHVGHEVVGGLRGKEKTERRAAVRSYAMHMMNLNQRRRARQTVHWLPKASLKHPFTLLAPKEGGGARNFFSTPHKKLQSIAGSHPNQGVEALI